MFRYLFVRTMFLSVFSEYFTPVVGVQVIFTSFHQISSKIESLLKYRNLHFLCNEVV